MKNKLLAVKKGMLRLMLALLVGVFAGAAPTAAFVSHAAETVAAAEAVPAAEEAPQSDGTMFMICFFGGILLLILFVVVTVVATAVSTAGVVGAQEDE